MSSENIHVTECQKIDRYRIQQLKSMNQYSIVARISRRYAIRRSLGTKHTRTLANARRVISLSLSLDLFWRYDHPTGVDGRNQTGPTYLPVSILPLSDSLLPPLPILPPSSIRVFSFSSYPMPLFFLHAICIFVLSHFFLSSPLKARK